MKYEVYSEIREVRDLSTFEFISTGKYGDILKRMFVPTQLPYVYNLAFGNVDEFDDIDDTSVSDNGDRNKILATVAKIIDIYTCVQ